MKKIILAIALSAIITTPSFANAEVDSISNAFTLKGTFIKDDFDNKKVYLNSFNFSKMNLEVLDSTTVETKTFMFTGSANEPEIRFLTVEGDKKPITNIILEPGNISLSIDSSTTITGTDGNDKLYIFNKKQADIQEQLKGIMTTFQKAQEDGVATPELETSLRNDFEALSDTLKLSLFNYAKENINNAVGEFMFLNGSRAFSSDQTNELLALLRPEFKELDAVKGIINAMNIAKATQVGELYTDIKLPNQVGKEVAISNYVGKKKAILIDFWASWCGPCIKEMPHVVAAYTKYKAKGLEIIGISLDEDKAAWLAAIKRLNMTWVHMSDLGGWKSSAAAKYNVTSIPMTLLLDKDGRIVAKNLRGADLEAKIAELLK